MVRDLPPIHKVSSNIDRRRFLKATGSAALVGGLAGCTGGGGGDGGGDGGGSDGGDLQEVSFASPPVGLPVEFVMGHLEENNRIQELYSEDGYELTYELTFEDATLFAAGQVDMTTMGYFEAARLGVEQEQNFVCFGDIEAVIQGVHVKTGGPYDPENTGSPQASLDKLVEDGGLLAIQSWAAGNTPFLQLVLEDQYGYTLEEDGGDFNLQTTDYGTMPQLLLRDELDAAVFAGTSGGSSELAAGDITTLFWIAEGMEELGMSPGPLVSLTTRQSFAEEHPHAVLNMVEMWTEGMQYIHDNVDELAADQEARDMLGVENEAAARFLLEYIVEGGLLYDDAALTPDRIEANRELLSIMEEQGQIPTGWQDRIEFYTPADLEGMT